MNIIIFGDSITWGAWDREGGWANRLARWANETSITSNFEKELYVYNLGVAGDTTEDLLERAKEELDRRVEIKNSLLIYAIGANDTIFDPKDDERTPKVSPEKFRENLERLLALGKYYEIKTIFVGTTPCNEDKTIPVSWDPQVGYTNYWLNEYRKIMEDVAQKNNVPYILMWDIFAEGDWRGMLPDGIHPNSEAHEKMFEEVKKFLEEKSLI